jgi:threonyl-tRNA synthetase
MRKIPYLIILGKKEVESGTISVRSRDGQEMKGVVPSEFASGVQEENTHRR